MKNTDKYKDIEDVVRKTCSPEQYKTVEDIISYYRNSAENMSPEQDSGTIDHLDKSCSYPVELVTLNAFPAWPAKKEAKSGI